MVFIDAVAELVTLIDTNWTIANTDNKKPNIGKITAYPKETNFDDGKGFILVYSTNISEDSAGLGCPKIAHEFNKLRIDIRVHRDETYFNKLRGELRRILYNKKINPTVNFDILETSNQEIQDLSNRRRLFFQEVRDVELIAYTKDMTA